jgi:hypothetical protein
MWSLLHLVAVLIPERSVGIVVAEDAGGFETLQTVNDLTRKRVELGLGISEDRLVGALEHNAPAFVTHYRSPGQLFTALQLARL